MPAILTMPECPPPLLLKKHTICRHLPRRRQDKPVPELGGKTMIDVANEAGVWLTNTAGSLTESTADAALLLLLASASSRRVAALLW